MKKTLLLLLLTFPLISIGQTLEHTYTSKGYQNNPKTFAFITDAGLNYYTIDNVTNQIFIYNSNHILSKTVDIALADGGTIETLHLATDKLFNDDEKIEFILDIRGGGSSGLILYNEDGTEIFNFGNKFKVEVFHDGKNNFKLLLSDGSKNGEVVYDIYALSGVLSDTQQSFLGKNEIFSFPNPASEKINIVNPVKSIKSEKLNIYDMTGRIVLEKNISKYDGENITLDISGLSRGTYMYSINGLTHRFVKK